MGTRFLNAPAFDVTRKQMQFILVQRHAVVSLKGQNRILFEAFPQWKLFSEDSHSYPHEARLCSRASKQIPAQTRMQALSNILPVDFRHKAAISTAFKDLHSLAAKFLQVAVGVLQVSTACTAWLQIDAR